MIDRRDLMGSVLNIENPGSESVIPGIHVLWKAMEILMLLFLFCQYSKTLKGTRSPNTAG